MKTQYIWIKLNYTVEQRYSHISEKKYCRTSNLLQKNGRKKTPLIFLLIT